MKAQRQIVDMAERIGGKHPRGMLADAREQHVAKLHEADHGYARNAVGEDQGKGNGQRRRPRRALPDWRESGGQRIHRRLVGKRHGNGDGLGGNQRDAREHQPEPEIGPSLGPDEGKQVPQDRRMIRIGLFWGGRRTGNGVMTQ